MKSLVWRAEITISGRCRGGIKSVAVVRIGIFFFHYLFLGKGRERGGRRATDGGLQRRLGREEGLSERDC